MAPEAVRAWLRRHRRSAVAWVALYSTLALASGLMVLLLTAGLVFLASKLMLLLFFPTANYVNAWSAAITALAMALISVDGVRASREDMSLFPVWLVREYVCIGPRVILDGWRSATQARRLAGIEIDPVAEILSRLAARKGGASQDELLQACPGLEWSRLVPQLRLIPGVIVFRGDESRVTLTLPLRLELRQLLGCRPPAGAAEAEARTIPVSMPERLSPNEILGVSSTASLAEIRIAYRNRVKECHPDRFASMDEHSQRLAEEWTKSLNAAYETLTTPRAGQNLRH